jgi:hypothetical protein
MKTMQPNHPLPSPGGERRHNGIPAGAALLMLLCVALAGCAALALAVDLLDADDDGFPADALSGPPPNVRCSLPPPSETARLNVLIPGTRVPHSPHRAPLSLRAPPAA